MQNTGTWNSDLAILFFFCLIAPIGMYFLKAFFECVSSVAATTPSRQKPKPKPRSRSTIVYVDRPVYRDRFIKTTKNKKKKAPEPSKKKAPEPPKKKAPEALTSSHIINEAATGLVNLGYKKGEATKVVKSVAKKKQYNCAESLVKDCFMCIS